MADQRRAGDHIGGYNFNVEIEGVAAGFFKGVDGLEANIEVIEYQDGSDMFLRKRPGRAKYGDVTLKKGYVANPQLQDWWNAVRNGKDERKSLSIVLLDNAGTEILRWNLFNCFISKWKMSSLDGKGNEALVEDITITTERIDRIGGTGSA